MPDRRSQHPGIAGSPRGEQITQQGQDPELRELASQMLQCISVFHGPSGRELHTRGEAAVLLHLHLKTTGTTPSTLAEALQLTSARIANILRSLESKGLIERVNDTVDRRRILVHLTEEGQGFVLRLRRTALDRAYQMLSALGPRDARELVRLMQRIDELVVSGAIPRPGSPEPGDCHP